MSLSNTAGIVLAIMLCLSFYGFHIWFFTLQGEDMGVKLNSFKVAICSLSLIVMAIAALCSSVFIGSWVSTHSHASAIADAFAGAIVGICCFTAMCCMYYIMYYTMCALVACLFFGAEVDP